jgi:hypothetical protein
MTYVHAVLKEPSEPAGPVLHFQLLEAHCSLVVDALPCTSLVLLA